jgi:hypothetical protein
MEIKWRHSRKDKYFPPTPFFSQGGGIRTPAAPQESIHEYTGKDTGFSVVLGHDLPRAVTSWDKLPAPLKAAILAIVNAVNEKEGQ